MSNSRIPTLQQLKRGMAIAEQIGRLEAEMAAILGKLPAARSSTEATDASVSTAPKARKKGRLSAAARERIAAAQRARWAKLKAKKTPAAPAKPAKKKRTLSAAARAKLAALMKARWEAKKKAAADSNQAAS
jgi:hypothetical protein